MVEHHGAVVVGGGLEGLSVARSLAERGLTDVLVLERGTLCSGGTARSSGVVRAHYGVRSLAAMARHGGQVLARAATELGEDVGFRRTGYLVGVGAGDVTALEANVAMQRDVGVDVALLGPAEARRLWPWAHVADLAGFGYEPDGGYGDAYLTGTAFGRRARRLGATLRQHSRVTGLTVDGAGRVDGCRLADGGRVRADVVVLAAGPWSVPLAATVGVDLPVRAQREQLVVVDAGTPLGPVPVLSDLVGLLYLRPEGERALLVGNSDHSAPELVDPDRYRERADPDRVDAVVARLVHRLPGLSRASVRSTYCGCYDVTPDYNPVIGPAPVPGLLLCAGFSGHGFKISAAVGRLVADLVLDGRSSDPDVDADDFRLSRFAEGRPLRSAHPYAGAGQMR